MGFVLLILLAGGGAAWYGYGVYKSFLPEKAVFEQKVSDLKTAIKEQNLVKIKEATKNLQTETERLQTKVQKYSYVSSLPKAGDYYRDIQHAFAAGRAGLNSIDLVVNAITPYADLLGLGEAKSEKDKTTMDRITFLVTTLDKIRPELDKIGNELTTVKNEIDQIDINRYPQEANGI